MKAMLQKLLKQQDLVESEVMAALNLIMDGSATQAQIAGFLTALRFKGETVEEITACARVMREKSERIYPEVEYCIDTCGTGGDGANTFNISTAASLIAAAGGVKVAKHGNRAMSSRSGSADVLEALGINIMLTPDQVKSCIEQVGIGFMFAQSFHKTMKYVAGARRELGIKTVFNILGPLTNPADAKGQVLGVFDENLTEVMASVLRKLGSERALVVHGMDGLDEITTAALTKVSELKDGKIDTYYLNTDIYGLTSPKGMELVGGDGAVNAGIIRSIFSGEKGARRDIVLINAAAALYVGKQVENLAEGISLAANIIDTGKAAKKLEDLIEMTMSFNSSQEIPVILDEIVQHKRQQLDREMKSFTLEGWKQRLKGPGLHKPLDFYSAIKRTGELSIIAEVKKASPSKGLIRADFDPAEIAREYTKAGVQAISVLTERDFFQGDDENLLKVRQTAPVPILRKDFIVDLWQVYQSRCMGADAILLIVSILSDELLKKMIVVSGILGMQCLVEVHDEDELSRALDAGAKIIGINNRNLKTFETDIKVTEKLINLIPHDRAVVSESGVKTAEDMTYLSNLGVDAVLIGETLMASASIQEMLDELRMVGAYGKG